MPRRKSYEEMRKNMLRDQIYGRGIRDEGVLRAMLKVPRHSFVPNKLRKFAYHDGPLRIGKRQTISQPYIVARMSELLALTGEETVLDIGTGSGYQAAVLGELARQVYTLEWHKSLADKAAAVLRELEIKNVRVIHADGSVGWPEAAPYDGILVAAASPDPAPPWLTQLKDGGRLVLPVGGQKGQQLQTWTRKGEDYEHEDIVSVSFVPLRGRFGWGRKDWKRGNR